MKIIDKNQTGPNWLQLIKAAMKGCLDQWVDGIDNSPAGVARPDWGQREVRKIAPGSNPQTGKLGCWRHTLAMMITSKFPESYRWQQH